MTDVRISVRDNGPFLVTGPVTIQDADGNIFETGGKETVALCRCGASGKRPFCDGEHNRCGFQSSERAIS